MEIEIVTTMAAEVAAAATAAAQSAAAAGTAAAAAGNAAAASNAAAAAKAAAAGQAVATGSVSNFVNVSAKIRTSAEEASKAVDKAADAQASRFEKLKKGVEGLHEALKKVGEGLTGIVPGLKGLEDFTSFSGLSSLAQRFGQFSTDLEAASRKLGVTTPALAAWHIAADGAGVSAKDFDTGMAKSQDAIRGASKGEAPKTAAAMRRLGVRIARNRDGSVNYGTTQERLMGALHGISNVVDQRDMAGKVGMTEWLPMIQQGTWNEDKAKASRRGLVPTEDEIAKGKAFKDDIDDLSQSVEGLGQRVGFALIPVLDPVVKKMGEWLNAHRAEIVEKIAAAVQRFVTWVSKIDWDAVGKKASEVFDSLGGVEGILDGIAAIKLVGLVGQVLSVGAAFAELAAAIPAPLLAVGALVAGSMFAEMSRRAALDKAIPPGPDHDIRVVEAQVDEPVPSFGPGPADGGLGEKIYRPVKRLYESISGPKDDAKPTVPKPDASMSELNRQLLGRPASSGLELDWGSSSPAISYILGPIAPRGAVTDPGRLMLRGGAAATGTPEVSVRVAFDNVPAGARVESSTSPRVSLRTTTRYSMASDMRAMA